MNLTVPVNIAYKIILPKGKVSITPYIGFTATVNMMGKLEKNSTEYDSSNRVTEQTSTELNLYDEEDMGYYYNWGRFQVGCQFGVDVNIKAFYIGGHWGWGRSIKYIAPNTLTRNWAVSVGVNF